MLNDITIVRCEVMSHLVRLRGKDTVQRAHCAMYDAVKMMMIITIMYDAMIMMMMIIIICVRCDHHLDDDHHHLCTMRSSS